MSCSAIGLPSGDLLTIGGYERRSGRRLKEIWRLKNDEWSSTGNLIEVNIQFLRISWAGHFIALFLKWANRGPLNATAPQDRSRWPLLKIGLGTVFLNIFLKFFIKSLFQAVEYPTGIFIDNSIFVVPGFIHRDSAFAIFYSSIYKASIQKIMLGQVKRIVIANEKNFFRSWKKIRKKMFFRLKLLQNKKVKTILRLFSFTVLISVIYRIPQWICYKSSICSRKKNRFQFYSILYFFFSKNKKKVLLYFSSVDPFPFILMMLADMTFPRSQLYKRQMMGKTLSINNELFGKAPDDLRNFSNFIEFNVQDFQLSHLQ